MCTQSQICAGISSVNKYISNKTSPKEYWIHRKSKIKAEQIYNLCSMNQKIMLQKIQTDLKYSKEYSLDSVIIYPIIRWFEKNEIWQFDYPDQYSQIKNNFKVIEKMFDGDSIKKESNILSAKITEGRLKIKDLFKIQSDGVSLLYKFYCQEVIGLAFCSTFADQLKGGKLETDEHKRFHKMLSLIKAVKEKN